MKTEIRKVVVLGAGTMGAQIAAHLANAGIPTLLLDLTEQVAHEGLDRVLEPHARSPRQPRRRGRGRRRSDPPERPRLDRGKRY